MGEKVEMTKDEAVSLHRTATGIMAMATMTQGERAIVAILLAAVRMADAYGIDIAHLHSQIDLHKQSVDTMNAAAAMDTAYQGGTA